jgi:hypothetical protein
MAKPIGKIAKYQAALLILWLMIGTSGTRTVQASAVTPIPVTCDLAVGQCFDHTLNSTHFIVIYNTTGPFATTLGFATNVSSMAETAYARLVVGYGFQPPARNPIPIYLELARGGFASDLRCEICPPSSSYLQRLEIEFIYKSPCPAGCGLPTSYWEVAHEFFHTIQLTTFNDSLPFGLWLAEGSANWAGYKVAGNESRWDPWVISAWLGPNGTTELSLDERSYDNAFFLVFLSDHYGGPGIIKRIMSAANRQTPALDTIVGALNSMGYHKTSAQLMNEFATAMITGNFTDKDGGAAVLRSLPPIATTTSWTGVNQTVSTFTNRVNGFSPGAHLSVSLRDGMEFVEVRPASGASLAIDIGAQNRSCFDATVIGQHGARYTTYKAGPEGPAVITSPAAYDHLFVAVTRGNCRDGNFSILLGAPNPVRSGIIPSVWPAAVILGLAVIAVLFAAFIYRRKMSPPAFQRLYTSE